MTEELDLLQDSNNRDSSWDAERATPSISKSSSGGQSTAASSGDFKLAHSGEDTDDDRGAMVSRGRFCSPRGREIGCFVFIIHLFG